MEITRAWVYRGKWVADCPRGCGDVEYAKLDRDFVCSECGCVARIEWPIFREEIEDALSRRPAMITRNWFPENHLLAVSSRLPHGQDPADLFLENLEHGIL